MKMPAEIIREEIAKNRVIPFARFMELALYCPETGYYEKNNDNVGRAGDFITSVSTGELFGQLLAFQFGQWLVELSGKFAKLTLIEAGAHDGKLAADILAWLQINRPALFAKLEYLILEPSVLRQTWQQATLKPFAPQVRWAFRFEDLAGSRPHAAVAGIFFSNELLDAMPVHRHGWDANLKTWFEWGVTAEAGKFIWAKISNYASSSIQPLADLPAELLAVLPDDYTVETSPAAEAWWRAAAGVLTAGRLLTIDYGHTADEIFSPSRTRGTVRAYFRHQVSDEVLANVGEQDLTAHVNFSAIQKAGEAAGLTTEALCSQPQFLTRILQKAVPEKTFVEWSASRTRQFQTLTHPEHLGRAFRVLVQGTSR